MSASSLIQRSSASRPVEAAAPAIALQDAAPALPWQGIPVFIVNRNRLQALSRLVDWLVEAGTQRIVILDNDSNYPPLLTYYDQLPGPVKVLRMGQNLGPYVLWQQGVHKVLQTAYVVTDSDVVPSAGCPKDLVRALWQQLQRYPDARKVGAALRIDDLPDSYLEADTVRKWESQFWEHPVAPGVFAAPVDTTFAIYPAGGEFSNEGCNLRLGAPYTAVHTPWYADEHALSHEERHYRANTSAVYSNWSVAKKDSWVKRSQRVLEFERRPQVLHIDSGRQYIPGWINAGFGDGHYDTVFDVRNARSAPLSLGSDSLDGIHLSHVLDSVRDAHALFEELYRVAKPNAKLVVRSHYGARDDAWRDPHQESAWTENSFARFAQPLQPHDASYRGDWRVTDVRLVLDPARPVTAGAQAWEVLDERNTIVEMIVTMVAVKPARPRGGAHPMLTSRAVLVADARFDPGFQAA